MTSENAHSRYPLFEAKEAIFAHAHPQRIDRDPVTLWSARYYPSLRGTMDEKFRLGDKPHDTEGAWSPKHNISVDPPSSLNHVPGMECPPCARKHIISIFAL